MGRRRAAGNVSESARLALGLQMAEMSSGTASEIAFPPTLSKAERAWVHARASTLGLRTKSRGKGAQRFVTVYRRTTSTLVAREATLSLEMASRQLIDELADRSPISAREKDELACSLVERSQTTCTASVSALATAAPQIPPVASPVPEILAQKRTLPVTAHRDKILEQIEANRAVIVVAETGSGKTTQIPQFILEQSQKERKPCKIICTQPRRISAVSVAERVAYERNEKIGQAVGYQIRLESRVTAKTVLTYCTNGILLRTLMGNASTLSTFTHIIIDEIHERDKLADFLLISLKEAMGKCKDIKVILMSATINASIFANYFSNSHILNIPGKIFEVQRNYLEEVLSMLKYKTEKMKTIEQQVKKKKKKKKTPDARQNSAAKNEEDQAETNEVEQISADLQSDVDEFLSDCLSIGTLDTFSQILYMYVSEGVPVDCQHSVTGMTGLMIAAYHGCMDVLEEIIMMGGNPSLKDESGKTAYDHALSNGCLDCANFLQNLKTKIIEPAAVVAVEDDLNEAVELYNESILEDYIDYELILALIKHIHLTQPKGGILVFVTGYEDITVLKDMVQACNELKHGSYQLFTLHSNMQTNDQKKVFMKSSAIRKIILSTNIAETSITIDDVVYVIDSGKVKEIYYESLTGVSSLQRCWISKACVLQRIGRAGRTQPGKAFMLYSKKRFESFRSQTLPEILRVPLHELCLHTKMLAPANTSIADFLNKAIEPPPLPMVKSSISLLKAIGALTQLEELTEIGHHLLGLNIDPKLGKMILYACVLKCLDPVLTIAVSLAVKDPFLITTNGKKATKDIRKEFSASSLSDHMTLWRLFQAWQTSHKNKFERKFCKENFINKGSMEMISGLRTKIINELRILGFLKKGVSETKDINQNSDKWYVVKAALTAGLYPSIARIDRDEKVLRSNKEAKLAFHPRSALHVSRGKSGVKASIANIPSDWIVFEEISRIGRICMIKCNTVVTAMTVAIFAGPLRLNPSAVHMNIPRLSDDSDTDREDGDSNTVDTCNFSVDDWISFTCLAHNAMGIYFLRQKFSALLVRRMTYPFKSTPMDDKIIAALVQVLGIEEKAAGLTYPASFNPKMETQNVRDELALSNNRPNQMFNSNVNNMPKSHNYQQNYSKQTKSQPGLVVQTYNRNKGPLSPSNSNMQFTNYNKKNGPVRPARYFIIKSADMKSVEDSLDTKLWTFNNNIGNKLKEIFQTGMKVIIFFSVEITTRFFGYAELSSIEKDNPVVFKLKWVSICQIFYNNTKHILNGLNENRSISSAIDGEEICGKSGEYLSTFMIHQDLASKKCLVSN